MNSAIELKHGCIRERSLNDFLNKWIHYDQTSLFKQNEDEGLTAG